LVNSNCDLKICDFGLARPLFQNQKANVLTEYVATRWYRAPELLLSANHYTTSVDMWSVGCIFAEMLQRKPFLPGTDTKNQIELICEYLGTPDLENMKHIPSESIKLIKNLPKNKKNGKDFNKLFSFAHPDAIDLLKKLLMFDPEKRITVTEALEHPYLADLHLEEDEPTREEVNHLDFEFEDFNLTTQQLKGTFQIM
jgi:serine/threonine protein kinase